MEQPLVSMISPPIRRYVTVWLASSYLCLCASSPALQPLHLFSSRQNSVLVLWLGSPSQLQVTVLAGEQDPLQQGGSMVWWAEPTELQQTQSCAHSGC